MATVNISPIKQQITHNHIGGGRVQTIVAPAAGVTRLVTHGDDTTTCDLALAANDDEWSKSATGDINTVVHSVVFSVSHTIPIVTQEYRSVTAYYAEQFYRSIACTHLRFL